MTLRKGETAAADDETPLRLEASSYDVEKLRDAVQAKGKTLAQAVKDADALPDINTSGAFTAPLDATEEPAPAVMGEPADADAGDADAEEGGEHRRAARRRAAAEKE